MRFYGLRRAAKRHTSHHKRPARAKLPRETPSHLLNPKDLRRRARLPFLTGRSNQLRPSQGSEKKPLGLLRRERNALPIFGLRSAAIRPKTIPFKAEPSWDSLVRNDRSKVPTHQRSLCQTRSDRRVTLFRLRIAGKGLRKSPGAGGTYHRTETSQISCSTDRR